MKGKDLLTQKRLPINCVQLVIGNKKRKRGKFLNLHKSACGNCCCCRCCFCYCYYYCCLSIEKHFEGFNHIFSFSASESEKKKKISAAENIYLKVKVAT